MEQPSHHTANGFRNEDPRAGLAPPWAVVKWLLTRPRVRYRPLRFTPGHYPDFPPPPGDLRVVYIGHATAIVEIGGLRIITDPVFSDVAAPVRGPSYRRIYPPGIPLAGIPPIDVVLVTHNHYDHLDEPTIRQLGNGPQYVVPLGLGGWFRRRGCTKVTELDWWGEARVGDVRITATPCQHWSRRTPFDTNKSLWCGFAITSGMLKVLFIGDSGYCGGFKRLGERLGPFHVSILPIGAYDPPSIMRPHHMNPEEASQALEDLGGGIMVPIHYGCFPLTDEDPREPPRRLYAEWVRRGWDLNHLWLLAPGHHRSLEDIMFIPTVRSEGEHGIAPDKVEGGRLSEWTIGICPHLGEMVDLEATGLRSAEDGALTLDHVRCSAHGDLDECHGDCVPCVIRPSSRHTESTACAMTTAASSPSGKPPFLLIRAGGGTSFGSRGKTPESRAADDSRCLPASPWSVFTVAKPDPCK